MKVFIILIVLVLLIGLYIVSVRNSLVRLKNRVKEAFATMDVYLKKRWDLIPNLVETVKGYAKHEKETLENIVKLRKVDYDNLPAEEKIAKNEELSKDLSKLLVIVENYPDLKASENFIELKRELSKSEEDIANSRKYYNGVVRTYNNKIEMFPSNIIASMFNYTSEKMFETVAEERQSVKVEF